MIGKKSKSVFNFFTYSRETWFSFSYGKVGAFDQPIGASNEIDRVSKFNNSLSFGAKQIALQQIFFALWFFKDLFTTRPDRPTMRPLLFIWVLLHSLHFHGLTWYFLFKLFYFIYSWICVGMTALISKMRLVLVYMVFLYTVLVYMV